MFFEEKKLLLLGQYYFYLIFQGKETGSICWWQRKIIDRDSCDVWAIECSSIVEHWIFVACNTRIYYSRCAWSMDGYVQTASVRLFEISVNFGIFFHRFCYEIRIECRIVFIIQNFRILFYFLAYNLNFPIFFKFMFG